SSTIRTDVLLKEGLEFGDADRIANSDDDEAVVPVTPDAHNASSVSLPMPIDDMPAELAAVLRRTGGLDNARLRRTGTPTSVASRHSAASRVSKASARSAARSEHSVHSAAEAAPRSEHSVRSAASRVSQAQSAKSTASANRSLTELDIVMGRTGGAASRTGGAASRASTAKPAAAESLRGGSSSTPPVANDSENELASVLRRTSGYAPSSSSSYAPSQASESRPESAASELKSVYPADTARPASGVGSQRSGRSQAAPGLREQAATSAAAGGYTPSPLRQPAYQPSQRRTPSPANGGDDEERSQAPPSPMPYRLPSPIFGRFPSPPAHIKNRAREQAAQEAADQAAQAEAERAEQQAAARGRPHSQSVTQETPQAAAGRAYPEDPVVDRLDLETGSLASRRSRPRTGSEFGSASTLMSDRRDTYDLPKVVEEDVDSLASYPSSARARSPHLVGGGMRHASASPAPTTLRGGGRVHPAFAGTPTAAKPACGAGCCGVCGEGVDKSDVVVRPQVMHASCLRCEACDCLLTTSTFRAIDGHVYCERDYQRFFSGEASAPGKAVAVRPGISDAKFQAMNRAIMESFTSVDDFLQHMRQLREKSGPQPGSAEAYSGDPAQVQRAGDVGVDRQTHYEREHVTSPSGTPWITERVVDKKVKTKVLEKRYPADGSAPASVKSRAAEPAKAPRPSAAASTLIGGGGRAPSAAARSDALRATNHSSASRPSTSLLNDTRDINGWEHPLCPVCSSVVYLNDRVVHEGYGYHKSCMRCQRCSQVTPVASAVRIKGAIYCKKHGTELLRRRSILMRKKSTMGRRSRHNRARAGVPSDRFTVDAASESSVPPVPQMPAAAAARASPVRGASRDAQPRRVTTALRNFLEAAAEQIESQAFAPITPEPQPRPELPRARAANEPSPARRPLPVPKPKAKPASAAAPAPLPPLKQPVVSHITSPPPSPGPASRAASRSIFSGSRESLYDPNVVDALRQEAQRQINGSQPSMPASPTRGHERNALQKQRMLSPCGPSIADALQKYASGKSGPASVSSEFDPFESQDPLTSSFAAPQQGFSPNAQLDNLERRFRNANFRPPWALKSQSQLMQ
ncbi:hypothetical protein IWW52_004233, partial [Coemansia sp. RSA 2704]